MAGHRVLPVLLLLARAILPGGSTIASSCSSAAKQLCNFICDCRDCSDESQCGYLQGSAMLGTHFACDFEEGDCGWQDVSTSSYRWVRGRANLASWGTGPHSDHTVGTDLGWFMATVCPPAKTTATAWLRSPIMQEAATTCEIRAWYHLSGIGLNQTERPVLHLAMANRDGVVRLWQSPQRGGEGWYQLVAYPGRITGQFQLIFSLTHPPACGAELVLDDIVFRNCGLQVPTRQQNCRAEESNCSQGSCLAQHRFCDGTDDCGDSSDENQPQCKSFSHCSFEENLCIWQAEAGPLKWERSSSLILGTAYGIPTRDHSINSRAGFFLHVSSATAARASSPARLITPTFQNSSSCSLVLYCHLHGSATSSLRISYVTSSEQQLVRERTGDLGNSWVRERVDFSVTESFKVLIEGATGTGGTVAIDDLILSPGCKKQGLSTERPLATLPSRAGTGPCGAGEVPCDSEGCVSTEQVCDFIKNCADGSDEKHCGATNFEAGAGGWHDVSVGWLRWGVHVATKRSDTSLTGAFLALQAGEGQVVTAAKARTPLLGPSGPTCAMELSYHIHSGPQGFLAISIKDPTTGTAHLAWHMQGKGSAAKGQVSIQLGERSRPFQVELLGLVDLQDSSSAVIDNVTFVQCHLGVVPAGAAGVSEWCSHGGWPVTCAQGQGCSAVRAMHTSSPGTPARELTCNFERGMCGWYQDQSSDFQWVRSTGQGQGSDHTTSSGYFLTVDPSAPWSRGRRAKLITYYQAPAATQHCLSFWYRLAGPQIGTLNLKLQLEGAEERVLWTQRGTQGSVWHRGQATLPATGRQRYRVAFEALRDGFLGDMALDDLALTAGSCRAEPSCSFEADACGLAPSEQGTWLRQSNGTGTVAGPPADHSTGTATGHYMVVSTGSLPVGQVAALTSQPYQPTAPTQCLAFWYQMSTRTPGSLTVFVEQSGMQRKVMGVSTMEGNRWHRGHVTVQPDEDWQVIFKAVGDGSSHGYIALDDLHVSDGACPEPASCDFEQDMCGWSSPSDPRLHSFSWGWKSGVPLAKYPGPEQDHTLGTRNGHYVHFDTSVLGLGGTAARLESQPLPAATDSCLHFWYHMDIPEHLSCGEVRVNLHSMAGQRTVWSVAGHWSRGWQSGVVPVQSPTEFQIIFEITTRRWPMEGTVALDDIVYSTGGGCHSTQELPVEGVEPVLAVKEKSSAKFVQDVLLGVLLSVILLALVAVGGWYWLKRRVARSEIPAESDAPQGFDNITFQYNATVTARYPPDESSEGSAP